MTTIPELKTHQEWTSSEAASIRRSWETRHEHTRNIGWCVLTKEVAQILGDFIKGSRVVEVFAGTGYLAHHLRDVSGLSRKEYRAYDIMRGYPYDRRYPGVTRKNAFMAPIKDADIVIMTWPCYANNNASRIVKKMKVGQCLIYNGESEGGCTGDDEFFDILSNKFTYLEGLSERLDDHHFRFFGIHDRWTIYQKIRD